MAISPQTAPPQNSIENSVEALQQSPQASASDSPTLSPPAPASPPPSSPPAFSPPKSPPLASPPPASPPPVTSPPPPASSPPPPKESPPPQKDSPPTASPPPPPPPPSKTPSSPPPPPNPVPNPIAPVFSPPPPIVIPQTPLTPPPSSPLKPSPSRSSGHPPPSPPDSSNTTTNAAIVAGIAVGGVIILATLIVCLIWSRSRKEKKKPYYINPGHPPKGAEMYYQASTQWNSPQPMEHIVKIPPPPGVMGTPIGHVGGWGAPAPPQPAPPTNTSSEFSSGFSGQHHTPKRSPSPMGGGINGFSKSQFTYEELAAATGGFSRGNLLGQGGFGFVHKGTLSDGREVAVKSLKSGSGQGEREFQAEVEIISRVHHRHLVSLVGYFVADSQRMLVYEFVPNGTLEYHLHGKCEAVMDWATRLKIALGSAKGLAYLHEDCHPRIIHRDIKAANILLDYNYEAMVADFGLAKLTSDNYTHVSTRVMGTFGYLAPEYASSGKLTEKSDVFSYGVMLLELITGRRPVDPTGKIMEDSLVDWARPLLSKPVDELVDPRLQGKYDPQEMARMVACAAASIRHSARRRPRMSQIVRALDGDSSLEDLNVDAGKTPYNNNNNPATTEIYDTGAYNADMIKFRKMVMSSQEFPSSEYGETSENGLDPSSSHAKEAKPIVMTDN